MTYYIYFFISGRIYSFVDINKLICFVGGCVYTCIYVTVVELSFLTKERGTLYKQNPKQKKIKKRKKRIHIVIT